MSRALDLLTGWLLFAGILGAWGSLTSYWIGLPRARVPEPAWTRDATGRWGRGASLLVLPALALSLVRQIQEFRDPFAPWSEDVGILLSSAWGTAWWWAVAAGVLMAAGFWLAAAGRRAGWWLASVAALPLALFPALTGHANAGSLRWFTLPADGLHVIAAGAWMGGLAVVLFLERGWTARAPEAPSLLPHLVPAFSPVAIAAVATLSLTGLAASWIQLPELSALWATDYGRLLVTKLLVVAGVLGLGALNWKRLTPRLGEPAGTRALRRAAALELLLANVVLLVTALLVRSSPTGH